MLMMQTSSNMKQMKTAQRYKLYALIINDNNPVSASFTATVSSAGLSQQ